VIAPTGRSDRVYLCTSLRRSPCRDELWDPPCALFRSSFNPAKRRCAPFQLSTCRSHRVGGKPLPTTEGLTTIGSPFDKLIASCKSDSLRLSYQFNYLTYQRLAMKPSNHSNPQPTVDLLRCRTRSTQMSKYTRIPFSLSISPSLPPPCTYNLLSFCSVLEYAICCCSCSFKSSITITIKT
jgi:hypothetical protein